MHKSNCRGASPQLLNHGLHAIDATSAPDSLVDFHTGEKLSKALDKLGGRYNLETSPGVRGNLQPAVQVCASGQRDAHYGAVLPALVVSILRHARFQPGETFADVGSGIGTAVLSNSRHAEHICVCAVHNIDHELSPF